MAWWRILGMASVLALVGCGASAAPPSAQAASHGGGGCACKQGGGEHGGGEHGGCGGKHGGGKHGGGKHGGGGMADHAGHGSPAGVAGSEDDRAVFHFLLDHREVIQRQVTRLPDGVATVTESDDPAVAQKIQEHVHAMHRRLQEKRPIHRRDPLFAATFASAEKVNMKIEPTAKGVRVVETSSDPAVVALIQAHADLVSAFLERGHEEVRKNHPVPRP